VIIGVPRETHRHEHRIGLTPRAIRRLSRSGHTVLVEKQAGEDAHFTDQDLTRAGARIVYTTDEACLRADLVARVGAMSTEDLASLRPGSIVCGFQHLAVAPRENVKKLIDLGCTAIGYEIIRDAAGNLPVLRGLSEIGGRMALYVAAHYLQTEIGGRGVMLGNIPGVPPPTVLILGAGTVGGMAARQARASGAHVIVLDDDIDKLRELNRECAGHVVTAVASPDQLEKYTPIADVVIGAVLIPGARAPYVITTDMVKSMKRGSVIVDVSIDQGGCVETSRPTTLDHPTFVAHGVTHYCVPNMASNVARTASRALANGALPYIAELADRGLEAALRADAGLAAGVYLYKGRVTHEAVGALLGVTPVPLAGLLEGSAAQ
jgi:alanine dehydrogenase